MANTYQEINKISATEMDVLRRSARKSRLERIKNEHIEEIITTFIGLKTLKLLCAECHEIWQPQPHGALRAGPSLIPNGFTFYENDITRTTTKTQN
jgi:hypothetical protein